MCVSGYWMCVGGYGLGEYKYGNGLGEYKYGIGLGRYMNCMFGYGCWACVCAYGMGWAMGGPDGSPGGMVVLSFVG